ncbi:MAG: hypothetical protein ACW9WZ_02980 [Nitrosopumilus sp.]
MGKSEKCKICSEQIVQRYVPMDEWNLEGPMCGKCYSKKLDEHYPGDHIRVNKELD